MHSDFSFRRLEDLARLIVPQGVLFLLFILNLINLPGPGLENIKPHFVLMAIYYWAIYRPTLVAPWLCFVMGLLMDFLSGVPVGLTAFVLVAIQWTVRDQRRFLMGQPYIAIWAVFGLVVAVVSLLSWGLCGLTGMRWTPLLPAIEEALISFFLFPLVTLLLVFAHRILPVASRDYP